MRALGLISVCGAVVVSGCVALPREKPVEIATLKGDYRSIADCSLTALRKIYGGDVFLAPLESRKALQIYRGEARLIWWTVDFSDAGGGRTSAVFRSGRAIWGERFYADQVMPSVHGCAGGDVGEGR